MPDYHSLGGAKNELVFFSLLRFDAKRTTSPALFFFLLPSHALCLGIVFPFLSSICCACGPEPRSCRSQMPSYHSKSLRTSHISWRLCWTRFEQCIFLGSGIALLGELLPVVVSRVRYGLARRSETSFVAVSQETQVRESCMVCFFYCLAFG